LSGGPRVAGIVACFDEADRVLVVKQTSGPFTGTWVLPGGGIEADERIEDGVRRELREETGYDVDELHAVALYQIRSVPPGRYDLVIFMFRGGKLDGDPRPEAGSELRWAAPSEIDIHPVMAMQLADLGLIERDAATLFGDLARAAIEMRRLF
jgi:8-oxo-dGTP diphosphatase